MDFGKAIVRSFEITDQLLRNDADDFAARLQDPVCQRSHRSYVRTTIDNLDSLTSKNTGQLTNGFQIGWLSARI
jgi:hypothetical protein